MNTVNSIFQIIWIIIPIALVPTIIFQFKFPQYSKLPLEDLLLALGGWLALTLWVIIDNIK